LVVLKDDWNALQFASVINEPEVTKTLLSDGAKPDFRTKVELNCPWKYVIIELNLKFVAFEQSSVIPQVTPLHIACRFGNIETVKVLAAYCDVNVQDQVGWE
jgi:ankyrin repeat protein